MMISKLPEWFFPGILIIVVVILNLNTIRNGLTHDDMAILPLASVPVSELRAVFEPIPFGAHGYQPVTRLSIALNRAISGESVRGFRTVNISLHLIAVLLVFLLGIEILKSVPLGFVGALLFAIHPVHVEAVQRLEQRGELLGAVAIFAALCLLMQKQEDPESRRGWRFPAILALYVFALLSTENAIAFMGLWVLFTFFFGERKSPGTLIRIVIRDLRFWWVLAVTGAYLGIHAVWGISFRGNVGYVENPLAYSGGLTRTLTAVDVFLRYLVLLVWPYHLSADYSYSTVPLISNLTSPRLLLSFSIVAVITAGSVFLARKRPFYLFCWLFFILSAAVATNLLFPVSSAMSEGALYLASAAVCWGLARAFHDLKWIPSEAPRAEASMVRHFKPAVIVLVCLIVPWGAKTYLRNAEWKDDWTLFRAAVRATPQGARAHFLLGGIYFEQIDYLGAERQYYQALQIYPDYVEAAIKLASTYEQLDRYPKALDLLRSFSGRAGAFESERLREMARVNVGLNYFLQAASLYEDALKLNEKDAAAHRELGFVYSQLLNQPDKGRKHLERSRQIGSGTPLVR
jgi:hypothetical protein